LTQMLVLNDGQVVQATRDLIEFRVL
jgi:hypothetical protein